MNLLIFIGALSLAVLAFEVGSTLQAALGTIGRNRRLDGAVTIGEDEKDSRRPSTWHALILAIFPGRFDPQSVKNMADVIDLLRRSGYKYATPGDFYAAALQTFSIFLAVGGLLAGGLYFADMPLVAPVIAAIFVVLGLRRPYVQIRMAAKERAKAMNNNMLVGLSVLESLLSSGVGVQEALRRTAGVGGPFCNLLGLLVARMEVEDFAEAVKTTQAHLPDPKDVEASLFLRDVNDYFVTNRPLLSGITALQKSVHRQVVEATQERASLVRQRSGLFGILAIIGMIFSLVMPYGGLF